MIEEQYLPEQKEIVISNRFVGENGQPIPWKIKALKEKEHQTIKKREGEDIEK